jgi:hypothetical protein
MPDSYPSTPGASSSTPPTAVASPAPSIHHAPRKLSEFPYTSSVHSSTSTLHNHPSDPVHVTAALEDVIARDSERIAAYGGDDPEDPPSKAAPTPLVSSEKVDLNLVKWDGPDDPENPLNWSRGRKWVVTWVVILLSINVYVHFSLLVPKYSFSI